MMQRSHKVEVRERVKRVLTACFVMAAVLFAAGAWGAVVEPLALTNRALGGGALNQYTPGVEGGVGLNNIGLLVRTWGRVTFVDTTNQFFYIDDGSGLLDGYSAECIGVRVSYANLAPGNTITPPAQGQFVVVTGISSTVVINSLIRPMLRPRRQADITGPL